MFEEYKQTMLRIYNLGRENKVDEYDRFFKAYLVGAMSMLISDSTYKRIIEREKGTN